MKTLVKSGLANAFLGSGRHSLAVSSYGLSIVLMRQKHSQPLIHSCWSRAFNYDFMRPSILSPALGGMLLAFRISACKFRKCTNILSITPIVRNPIFIVFERIPCSGYYFYLPQMSVFTAVFQYHTISVDTALEHDPDKMAIWLRRKPVW